MFAAFAHAGPKVVAVKETTEESARREYQLLRRLDLGQVHAQQRRRRHQQHHDRRLLPAFDHRRAKRLQVGQPVVAGAGRVAKRELRAGNRQVQEQNAEENARNRAVSVQKVRASGTGHQRSCTLPMMYFFGTKPQCRLSELLFR